MLLKELNQLAQANKSEKRIEEAADTKREYEGSHEYDADQSDINDFLAKAMKIARSPAFKKHMRDTDQNYSTSAVEMARRAEEKLGWAIKAYEDLYDHMMEAS
jgi:hypothetical protein